MGDVGGECGRVSMADHDGGDGCRRWKGGREEVSGWVSWWEGRRWLWYGKGDFSNPQYPGTKAKSPFSNR